MTETFEERIARIEALPHVKAWVRKLSALSKAMPKEIAVYVASGTPTILVTGEDGCTIMAGRGDSADPRTNIGLIPGGRWDGGDW